jgi:hypothetical protein
MDNSLQRKIAMTKTDQDRRIPLHGMSEFPEDKARLLCKPWATEVAPGHRHMMGMMEEALERTQGGGCND